MKILVICDDFWHPGEVIVRGLSFLEREGYALDVVTDAKDMLYPAMLREYAAILNAKGNAINAANRNPWFEPGVTAVMPGEFRAYVEEGHGFIALHSGNCYSAQRQADMAQLTGNDFIGHPPQCDIRLEKVGNHPIMQDVEPFIVRDEHYRIHVHARDAVLFMTSTSSTEAGTQPAGYSRTLGKGRLCCLTPGHNYAVFQNTQYKRVLKNALDWCVGKL